MRNNLNLYLRTFLSCTLDGRYVSPLFVCEVSCGATVTKFVSHDDAGRRK